MKKIFLLISLLFSMSLFFSNKTTVQSWSGYGLKPKYLSDNQHPLLGDRVNITVKAYKGDELFIEDKGAKFEIKNPKPGQKCEIIDHTFKEDGTVTGYCESLTNSGNLEMWTKVEDDYYEIYAGNSFNIFFNDPNEYCNPQPSAPVLTQILKQNDLTITVKWSQSEPFSGYFEVLYGTNQGIYTNKQRKDFTSQIENEQTISSLDPSKEYYFAVKAYSTCKTELLSNAFKYNPLTGQVSPASNSSATPKPTSSPIVLIAAPKPTAAPEPSPTPTTTPTLMPEAEENINNLKVTPTLDQLFKWLILLSGIGLFVGSLSAYYYRKQLNKIVQKLRKQIKNKNTSESNLQDNQLNQDEESTRGES